MDTSHNIQDGHIEEEFKVYKRRWYILIIYSLYSFIQSLVWNTWSPIASAAEDAFNWSESTIAWLTNWGSVTYVLTGLLFSWLLHVKGLRWATFISMFCVFAGTTLRVITSEPSTATILIHAGQIMNGLGGPISSAAIPAVSAVWFPPSERVTATALSNGINTLGSALAFILGPALVHDMPPSNKSAAMLHKFLLFVNYHKDSNFVETESDNITIARRHRERHEIMWYMYYVCGSSIIIFIIMVCYFPAKPPHPPCLSATQDRNDYWRGFYSLKSKGYFLVVTVLYGVSMGIYNAWTSVLYLNVRTVGISQERAGWLGFYSTVAGCFGQLLVGRFASQFVRHLRLFILVMYTLATAALVIFTLMLIGIVPMSIEGLFATTIIASTAICSAIPLMFELACELAFPTGEATATAVITIFSNAWSLVFLVVLSLHGVGTMWMNWSVIASTAVAIPLLLIFKGRFHRLEVDECLQTERYANREILVPDTSVRDSQHISVVSGVSEEQEPLLVHEHEQQEPLLVHEHEQQEPLLVHEHEQQEPLLVHEHEQLNTSLGYVTGSLQEGSGIPNVGFADPSVYLDPTLNLLDPDVCGDEHLTLSDSLIENKESFPGDGYQPIGGGLSQDLNSGIRK